MSEEEKKEKEGGIKDYLHPDHMNYGMAELGQVDSVGFFLPMLLELFNVNATRTKVVYSILYSLMIDDRVRWTRAELDDKFHWIKSGQRSYLLQRLSNVEWLEYFREQGVYMITDKGEAIMRILSRFNLGETIVENEGAALAEIEVSMMLDLGDMPDRLKFLRNRLSKHTMRAQTALESESAYRSLEIYQQLQSAHRWAEQTRETLDQIDVPDDDGEQWSAIRSVHSNLATLHNQISEMQMVMQDIQYKQINIAKYGLTHLDFDNYLINSSLDHLANIMSHHMELLPHPFLLLEDIAFAEAGDIIDREIVDDGMGRGWETDVSDLEPTDEDGVAFETDRLADILKKSSKDWVDMAEIMNVPRWDETAYRFQIMTMLADLKDLNRTMEGGEDPLLAIPLDIEFSQSGELVEMDVEGETQLMTQSRYKRKDSFDE